MKKWGARLLIVVMLFSYATVFAQEERSTDTILLMLESDWSTYLWIHETLYGSCLEALDFALQYCRSGSWDDLIRARASAVYALKILNRFSGYSIESALTEADYQKLRSMGMDLNDVATEFRVYNTDTLARIQSSVIPAWQNYVSDLMTAFFSNADLLRIREWCDCAQGYILAGMKYTYLMNNYTVLQLPPENAAEFLQWCDVSLPRLAAVYPELFPTENDVLNEMNSVVGEIGESVRDFEEYRTSCQVLYEMEAEAVQKLAQETSFIRNQLDNGLLSPEEAQDATVKLAEPYYSGLETITGVSVVLPYPTEMDMLHSEYLYYWKDTEGNITTVDRPFLFDTPPNCFHMKCSGIDREGFWRYALALSDMGLSLVDMNDTAVLFLLKDGTELMISFTDSRLQIHSEGKGVCFLFAPYMLTEYWYNGD